MRFKQFEIENFKGIKYAKIEFANTANARVYSLVGLNESGKTTILEAIHSFSPDSDTEIVVGSVETAERISCRSCGRFSFDFKTRGSGDWSCKLAPIC